MGRTWNGMGGLLPRGRQAIWNLRGADSAASDDRDRNCIMASDAPKSLNRLGQSLWLDKITPHLLERGALKRYIEELSVTGLTSNPTIFDNAITKSNWYDEEIRRQLDAGAKGEGLFFNMAVQ